MANSPATNVLNHLIEVNKDAESGLRAAAESVQNSELDTLFTKYASQHAEFASELGDEVTRLGGDAAVSGSVGGAIARGWAGIKAAVSGNSPQSLLNACEEGERSAEVAYLNAVDAVPSGRAHKLIQKQCEQVKGFRTRLIRLVGEAKDGVEFQKNE